jgi:maleylacetoacetate isomerase
MTPILHGYWRSGTTYRTRIALNLKGVAYATAPVNLIEGVHKSDDFLRLNPQGLVPALEVDGRVLTQSPAILEWLEEAHPTPPLLPRDTGERAEVRAMAAVIGCDIHPLNNLRVMKTLRKAFDADPSQTDEWAQRWIAEGFAALEQMVARHGRGFAYGDAPTLADCYLVPQVYSARRFNVDLEPYPALRAASAAAEALPAVAAAHPDRQPDAQAS